MKKLFSILISIVCISYCPAQDIFTRGLVYQSPDMKKAIVKENNPYRTVHDTTLNFNIYYPPGFTPGKLLPLVIFNNGVGSMDLPRWGIYKDWAKLVAANGMIAVTYQSLGSTSLQDGEALLDYLLANANTLHIDSGKIGLWTCSANARNGMRLAHKTRPVVIKALVVFYGSPDSLGQLRQNLPTLLVRAGLDAQFINTGIDQFIQVSLQQDTRLELINYLNGIHAFDAFDTTAESKQVILRTVSFFENHLTNPVKENGLVLTNKNFMWLVMNYQLQTAVDAFRNARTKYRADSNFQPFYNAVIREDVLNANAYWLLQHQRQNDAIALFKLAVESYPESPNAYESLSEAYELAGNKTEALINAELCLQKLPAATGMNENFKTVVKQSAEQRITRLGGKIAFQPGPPNKRAHHELVYDEAAQKVLLTAGSTPLNGGQSYAFYNDLWHFDGKEWKQVGIAGNQRSGTRMAYHSRQNKIYAFGGFENGHTLGDLRVLENGDWKTLTNDTVMKAAEAGFVYDANRDKLIAFGGSAKRGVAGNATWEWDGSTWKKFEGEGPGGRQAFAMVYDAKRKKTIVFGGMDGEGKNFDDAVWEFDGRRWLKITSNGEGPGPRTSPGYAYDTKRGMLIIFGGSSNGVTKNDTWAWDGKAWKQLATTGPSPRVMGYMAYDKNRDRVVLFGGRPGWPNDANDTWEWDGTQWKEIK